MAGLLCCEALMPTSRAIALQELIEDQTGAPCPCKQGQPCPLWPAEEEPDVAF